MSETAQPITITPDAKLSDVLMAFPQLEPIIADLIPSFGRLHTAALRESVAKTLTLEQLAAAGNASPVNVVMTLRKAAGLSESPNGQNHANAPEWVKNGTVARELDARPLLAQGHHPKSEVLSEFASLKTGQIFLLITPFVPAPLVELGRGQGLATWSRQGDSGRFETYFGKID